MFGTRRGTNYGGPANSMGFRTSPMQRNSFGGGQQGTTQFKPRNPPFLCQVQHHFSSPRQQYDDEDDDFPFYENESNPSFIPPRNLNESKHFTERSPIDSKPQFSQHRSQNESSRTFFQRRSQNEVKPLFSSPIRERENTGFESPSREQNDRINYQQNKTPHWMKINKGRVVKTEKIKKRSKHMKKLLQPKNALMVVNEILGNTTYEIDEIPPGVTYFTNGIGPMNFKAKVTVDGQIFEGFGKNKPSAKAAAAESVLRHIVKSKFSASSEGDLGKTVETTQTEENEDEDMSYCHLASFALYKLCTAWEDTSVQNVSTNSESNNTTITEQIKIIQELKPSKKMPEHPELLNPVMLLNQMCPGAVYEEISKTGVPPTSLFTVKCTLQQKSFLGKGQNKKTARRDAAFQACKELLNIKYPTEEVTTV